MFTYNGFRYRLMVVWYHIEFWSTVVMGVTSLVGLLIMIYWSLSFWTDGHYKNIMTILFGS